MAATEKQPAKPTGFARGLKRNECDPRAKRVGMGTHGLRRVASVRLPVYAATHETEGEHGEQARNE